MHAPPHPAPHARRDDRRHARTSGGFHLGDTLRQIETYVVGLRHELSQAQSALRKREADVAQLRKGRRPVAEEAAPAGAEDAGTLRRLNVQLQDTVTQLRQQLEELAAEDEQRAAVLRAHSEPAEQFKALLGAKCSPVLAEFLELEKHPADERFREHYRILLEEIFDVLRQFGIDLKQPETEPSQARARF